MTTKVPQRRPGKNAFRYRQQFGVIVICATEAQQRAVYNRLRKAGNKCKVVTV